MSRSRRFDKRDFWETPEFKDKKRTRQMKKRDRKQFQQINKARSEKASEYLDNIRGNDRYDDDDNNGDY